jgi:hypothetical protein
MQRTDSAILGADEDPTRNGGTTETADSAPEERRASEMEHGLSCEPLQVPEGGVH